MTHFRGFRLIVASLALVLVTSACGGFAKKGDAPAASGTDDTSAVGEGVTLPPSARETTAPTTAPPTTAKVPGAPEPVKGPRGPANQTVRSDPSGFRVTLTLDGKLRYSTKADIKMQLDVDNESKSPLRYDSNQTTYFQIRPANGKTSPAWKNDLCDTKGSSYRGPPVTLEPGQGITLMVATYPGERSNKEDCRVLTKGEYLLVGLVTWCTDDAMKDGLCDPAKAKTVSSTPIKFVLE